MSLFDKFLDGGHDLMILKSLLDHNFDLTAVQRDDAFVKHNDSNSKRKKNTRG